MKKIFLFIVLIMLSACNDYKNEKIIIGVVQSSFNHLPLQIALQTKHLEQDNYIIIPFESAYDIQKELAKNKLDAAIIPSTYAWQSFKKNKDIRIASGFERKGIGIIAQKKLSGLSNLENKKIGVMKNSLSHAMTKKLNREKTFDIVQYTSASDLIDDFQDYKLNAVSFYVPTIFLFPKDFHIIHWFEDRTNTNFPRSDLVVNLKNFKLKGKDYSKLSQKLGDFVFKLNGKPQIIKESARETYNIGIKTGAQSLYKTKFLTSLTNTDKDFEYQINKLLDPKISQKEFNKIYLK